MKERIKMLRQHTKLTQQKFADKLGLKRQTIAAYETGIIEPSDSTLLLMCKVFGINDEWLRWGTGNMRDIPTDDYTKISVDIDKNDPRARKAIIDYWHMSDPDKELLWTFVDKFLKKEGEF